MSVVEGGQPEGWAPAKLNLLFRQIPTSTKKILTKDCLPEGQFPVIDQGQSLIAGYCDDSNRSIQIDDPVIVFGDHTRVVKWISFAFVPGADGTKVLNPVQPIQPRYFYYLLRNLDLPDRGYGRHFQFVNEAVVAIAPLAEQKVIADKLDALLAQVDTLKARLDAIPAILKRFRQSVLSAAVTGKLTEDWRSQSNLPAPGYQLVGDLCSIITKGASPNWQGFEYVDDSSQTLFVTSENVGTMRLLLDKMKFVQNAFNEKQRRSVLRQGDVLTNIVGASIGRSAIWCRDEIANINQAVCVLRPDTAKVLSEYLCFYLNSPIGIDDMIGRIVEVARANVSLASINSLKIIVPTLQEQTEIVRCVESLFAFADQIEARAQEATARVKHLTQSILAKAFRGELTAEWRKAHPELVSGENSAEALLERIRASRASEGASPSRGRRSRADASTPASANTPHLSAAEAPKRRGRPRKEPS